MGNIFFYKGDLPACVKFKKSIAIDTETMGLNILTDRLCLVQLGDGKGNAYLVQIIDGVEPKNLKKWLIDKKVLKIFHFGRFDIAGIQHYLGVTCAPVYCTKIAHKLVFPEAESHSLKTLCQQFLGITLSKEQQVSNWGASELSDEQKTYAAGDVLYLHELKERLDALLKAQHKMTLAKACFEFLPTRAQLDLLHYDEPDIFAH